MHEIQVKVEDDVNKDGTAGDVRLEELCANMSESEKYKFIHSEKCKKLQEQLKDLREELIQEQDEDKLTKNDKLYAVKLREGRDKNKNRQIRQANATSRVLEFDQL